MQIPSKPPVRGRPAPRLCRARSLWWLALVTSMTPAAAAPPAAAPEPVQIERGLPLLDGRLGFGGYATLRVRALDDEEARFDIREASLFVTWTPAPRWLFFTEVEIEEALTLDDDGADTADAEVMVERLYGEYATRSGVILRAGKFLTPIGRWNQTHADPLVWTISRPLGTSLPFATQASGVAIRGTLAVAGVNALDYIVYLDDSKAFDPGREDASLEDVELPGLRNAFDDAAGMQLRYHFWNERAEIALSYASFDMRDTRDRKHLVGFDGKVTLHGVELSTETLYRASEGREKAEWGAHAQAAVPLVGALFGIARYEHYVGSTRSTRIRLATLGLAWRPRPSLVFKLEYRHGDDNAAAAPNGVLSAFSVLF